MYKVLVVDDEPRHRRGLAGLIRNLRPNYHVLEAKDGEKAFKLISESVVDILITDIKMPRMEGLQLIEALGSRINEITVVILSVYSYFEYAQKAISLGAFDYMLKPVDEEKIRDLLEKVERKIERERITAREKESLVNSLNMTLPIYLEHQMNGWINGLLNQSEMEEIEKLFPYKGRGAVISTKIGRGEIFGLEYTNEEINDIKLNIKYWMKEALNRYGHSISFFLEHSKHIMVTILNKYEGASFSAEGQMEELAQFIKNVKSEYDVEVTIGLSNEAENIFKSVRDCIKQANLALEYRFYIGPEKVIQYSEIIINYTNHFSFQFPEEDLLSEAILQSNSEDALSLIEDIFNKAISKGYPPPNQIIDAFKRIIVNIYNELEKIYNKEQDNSQIKKALQKISQCKYFDELKLVIRERILCIIALVDERKDNKNEIIIKKSKQYIEEHYQDDLSLESIAKHLRFSTAYFSSFFKSNTGMGVTEYVMDYRMAKASKLLKKTDYKVYEIAEKVGYRDSKYFIRMFKKKYSVTPEEFRRNYTGTI